MSHPSQTLAPLIEAARSVLGIAGRSRSGRPRVYEIYNRLRFSYGKWVLQTACRAQTVDPSFGTVD